LNRACATLCLLWAAPVWAQAPASSAADGASAAPATDPTKLRCAQAYEQSQRLRQDGKLRSAREQALVCAQASCPAVLSGDCATWLVELEGAIPSVVVEVRDAQGQALTRAQVSVDGEPLTELLDGRALPLDPGERHFRIALPGGQRLERSVVVTEAKKSQYLRFDVAKAPAALVAPRARGLSPWAYGAAAAAVMGGVGFGYFGLQGRAEEQRLDDSCAPRCSRSDISALGRTYAAADVSLGVGLAALGVLSYLWLTNPDDTKRAFVSAGPRSAGIELQQRF
jgi:hypothetical protein